jgi:branched-chain amino acid transport system permease protein
MKNYLPAKFFMPWIVLTIIGAFLISNWASVPNRWTPTLISGLSLLYLAYCWNIVGGIIGELAFAHMVFWGIGAYGYILMARADRGFQLTFVLIVVLAAAFGWLLVRLGTALGLEGLFLTTFSLIVFEFIKAVVIGTKSIGGNEGLLYFNLDQDTASISGYIFIVLVLLAIGINSSILSSSLGRKWLAIKDDEIAAQATGIFGRREKVTAYVISGVLTSFGGAAQAYYLGYAQPDTSLGIGLLISVVIAVYLGGPGTRFGPLIGVLIIYTLDAFARDFSSSIKVSLYAQLFQYSIAIIIFGLLSLKKFQNFNLMNLIRGARKSLSKTKITETLEVNDAPIQSRDSLPVERTLGAEILHVEGIGKSFGGAHVLTDVSFSLREGEILGLIGPNGAGKTTLCNILTGVYKPNKGSLALGGVNLLPLSTPQRFHMGLGRTFQAARIFQSLTVEENIRISVPKDPHRVDELLKQFNLSGNLSTRGSEMFIRRLTEIARAIATKKKLLILDEPLAGLTPAQHQLVLESIKEVAASGTAVIIIEHLVPTVAPVCDRIVVLHNGSLIANGPASQVLNDEAVLDAYLGKSIVSEA